jgi:hypothetical protein
MEQSDKLHAELLKTASLIMGDDAHEIRLLPEGASFHAQDPEEAVMFVESQDAQGGIYISMNPVLVVPAKDENVVRFKWLGIDIDAKQKPRLVADGIKMYLQLHGFPEPVVGFSGRGVWLLYKVDQPNDDYHRTLRQRFLKHLHDQDGGESVDVSVFNASRVMRFFGTINPKGSRSRIWSVPENLEVLDDKLIENLVGPVAVARTDRATAVVGDALPLSGQATAYGESALRECLYHDNRPEWDALRDAPEGTRNTRLAAVSRRLKELVAEQQIDFDYALAELWTAAEESGLTDGEELSHTRTTIRHNFEDFQPSAVPALHGHLADESTSNLPAVLPKLDAGGVESGAESLFPDGGDDWDEEIPPIEWLVPKRIARGTLIWAYGPKEVGKSLYFLGVAKYLTDRGEKVSFYSEEMGRALDVRRLTRVGIKKENFRWWNGKGLNLADKKQLAQVIKQSEGTSLVIFDSYEKVWQSSTMSENRKAVEFSNAAQKIIRATGATVIIIDHTGFGTYDEHGNYHEQRHPRAASTKEQQADMSILFESRGKWAGPEHPFFFTIENMKAGRLENPFKDECEVRNTPTGGLVVVNTTLDQEGHNG